jgi:maltose alpha-D-glucosyltransferase/alpha-amylase
VPVELFGHTRFPPIGELPYFLTFGPHTFYWFKLEQPQTAKAGTASEEFEPEKLEVAGSWEHILTGEALTRLERALPAFFLSCRWFGGKAQQIRSVRKADVVPVQINGTSAFFTTWEIQFLGAVPEVYVLPLGFATGERAFELRQANPQSIVAQLKVRKSFCDRTLGQRLRQLIIFCPGSDRSI